MGKRIAVFSSPWSGEHVGGVFAGMRQKAVESGVDVYIFNSYGGYEGGDDFNNGEYRIFDLPDLSEFDGVLLILNTVRSTRYISEIFGRAKACGIPCISLDQEFEGERFIGTDNYRAMYDMVEHLIKEHGCRTLNFVGGPADHVESRQRQQGFCDALKNHGIPVDERRVRNYTFVNTDGRRAFEDFKKDGLEAPDAVVCANDEMAIGYVETLLSNGYQVPEGVRVTGFDYSPYGQNYYPEIASVQRSCRNLGYDAVACLLRIIDGEPVDMQVYSEHRIRPNTSCGCYAPAENYSIARRKRHEKEQQELHARWCINILLKQLLASESEAQLVSGLRFGLLAFSINNICLLVDEETYDKEYDYQKKGKVEDMGYPERMRLLFWNRRPPGHEQTMVDSTALIPDGFIEDEGRGHVLIVSPLHLRGVNFGYCVIEDCLELVADDNLFYLLGVINSAIESVRQSDYIRRINEHLQSMYYMDAMTGVYNRFAIKEFGEKLLRENMEHRRGTVFLFADMDGLKVFNDTYGHDMGDEAIKRLARIMKDSCADDTFFCVRYGGDEFLLVGSCESDERARQIKKSVQGRIAAFNRKGSLPRDLSASLGYVFAAGEEDNTSIDYYISKADEMMYQIKKKKKEKRG